MPRLTPWIVAPGRARLPPLEFTHQLQERPLENLGYIAGGNRMAEQGLGAPEEIVCVLGHGNLDEIALGRARRLSINMPWGMFGQQGWRLVAGCC